MMKRFNKLILGLAISVFLSGCATVNVGNMTETRSFSPEDDERRLWNRAGEYEEIINKSGLIYEDKELTAYLQDIADNFLPEEIRAQDLSVTVRVIADPSFNAFVLPNGAMYVHTGLLANMDNEAQAAAVVAHELVHFINRHSIKQFRSTINKSAFFSTVSLAGAAATGYGGLASILAGTGFMAAISGYSQALETEADTVGFSLYAEKYEVSESVRAFENLEREIRERDEKEPYFFSSHPRVKTRIKNFTRLSGEYQKTGGVSGGVINEEIYQRYMREVLLDNAALDIKKSRYSSAERGLNRFVQIAPEDPRGYYYLGEACLNRGEEGDKDKAVENYKKAISLDESYALPHGALGRLYYKDKRYQEALKAFESYLALDPQAKDGDYIRAYIQRIKEKEEKEE